ncbi:uncharacterized protein Z520_07760 [Fonsecaea multimorphosa CBS 102226]|uniref:Xylanolytic transcriptional activator regulatory domain-containing protein n=1 Tax=Fonsecaea multimorphosa CBS 102226 TaxID=1442371 RepID=A0A0D2K0M0_9EURO|nr:uncharacterized protein Z520_07760 [Fonsecaea multimorphosa CBS 102226]KIX96494.1 hypothetical protein Z520_07760 [Fonsecaea multimorphosa CBS 102226]OAL28305.1 hypothetical protein AYO22_03011 [Fonsecaea multimorphosa]
MTLSRDPFPVTARPSPWWEVKILKPTTSGDTVFGHLSLVDVFFLTRLKNILYFPETSVAYDFFLAFRDHVLPTCPVIDRCEMTKVYDSFCSGHVTSPLLINSIFFSSSQYVSQESLTKAGFDSPHEAKEYFYERTTMLYALNCEHDQLKIIQALLFISTWWSDFSEEKGTKYWISCAANLALSMGLHKAVPVAARLSQQERSIWRRVFWTVYSRDCNVSIAMGRPLAIHSKEIDVEELSDADFYEGQDEICHDRPSASHGKGRLDFTIYSNVHVFYAVKTARQSALLTQATSISLEMALGSEEAVKALVTCKNDTTALRAELSDYLLRRFDAETNDEILTRTEKLWIIFLQLSTERTLSVACLFLRRHIERCESWHGSLSLSDVKAEMVRAAARTLNIYEELLELGCLRYSPNFVNTPIFGAMVTYTELIKEAQEEGRVNRIATNKYQLGIMILEELEQLWPASAWACSLFKILADKDFLRLRKLPHASRWQTPDPTGEVLETTISPDGPSGGESASGFNTLQDLSPFFNNINTPSALDAMFSNDLFDPQMWYAAAQASP